MGSGPNRDAWLWLRMVPDIGRMRFHRLVSAFGSPEAALGASAGALRRVRGMDSTAAENVARHEELVDLAAEKELIEQHGVRLVVLADDEYPANLRQSYFPPPLLYARGELEREDRFSIAVVGSRTCSMQGRLATERVTRELTSAGIVVVSGLALGIDATAHRAALKNGGRTLAVMANGLARCYPAEHRNLMNEIAETGVVFSEYPMNERPARMNFPDRNQIIATMTLGTIVAEAPAKSGALITADMALNENRTLYAIPSDITRKTGEGSNRLIQNGAARLIVTGADVLEDLHGQLRGLMAEHEALRREEDSAAFERALSDEERKIIERLGAGPMGIDDLIASFGEEGITIGRLSTLLLGLEMKKAIRQLPGKIFVSAV